VAVNAAISGLAVSLPLFMRPVTPVILGFIPWYTLYAILTLSGSFMLVYVSSFAFRLMVGGCGLFSVAGRIVYANSFVFQESISRIQSFDVTKHSNIAVHLRDGRVRVIPNISLLRESAPSIVASLNQLVS
jgi:hypothetical protein